MPPGNLNRICSTAGNGRRRFRETRYQTPLYGPISRVRHLGDDEIVANVAPAEALREDCARRFRVGTRDRELVRETARQQGEAGEVPDQEHDQPNADHRPATSDQRKRIISRVQPPIEPGNLAQSASRANGCGGGAARDRYACKVGYGE